MTWAIASITFLAGIWLGILINSWIWKGQDWQIMKWHDSSLGYRPAATGQTLKKSDKVVMALSVDASQFPAEGLKVE